MGDDSERTTPTVCESCGGDVERRNTCLWCERTGMLTPERLALYRASREQRVTGQFQAWQSVVKDLIEILKGRGTAFTRLLAAEGERLLNRYEDAVRLATPMSQVDRSRAVSDLREFHDRALAYLASKR